MFWGDTIQPTLWGDPKGLGGEFLLLLLTLPPAPLPFHHSCTCLPIHSLRLPTQPPTLLSCFRRGGSGGPLKQERRDPGRAQMDKRTDEWKERRVP